MESLSNLVIRLKNSDRDAFSLLYIRYYRLLLNYVCLMLDEDEAKDAVHNVFLKLWMKRDTLTSEAFEDAKFRAWLLRTAYNTVVSDIRHKHSDRNHRLWLKYQMEQSYSMYDYDRSGIIRKLYGEDLGPKLTEAIGSLPEKCRNVFILNYVDKLSAKEIAERLSLSVSTVENHIHNALVRLRKILIDER